MDTDDCFREAADPPYTTKRAISERLAFMRRDIAKHENVVIAGSLVDRGDELIPLFALAIRVETDSCIRIARLRARELERLGSRIDPGGDMYDNHIAFLLNGRLPVMMAGLLCGAGPNTMNGKIVILPCGVP